MMDAHDDNPPPDQQTRRAARRFLVLFGIIVTLFASVIVSTPVRVNTGTAPPAPVASSR